MGTWYITDIYFTSQTWFLEETNSQEAGMDAVKVTYNFCIHNILFAMAQLIFFICTLLEIHK